MKKLLRFTFVTVVAAMGATMSISAQSYYDDDIYYDASKAKKEQKQKIETAAKQAARSNYVPSQPVKDYAPADTYTYHNNSTRDVDEYNRRYVNTGRETTDSITLNQFANGDFTYTERIERFSNPDIVTGSGDQDLQYYYYNTDSQPSTTIVINNIDPWGFNSFYDPWYYNSWYSPYYSPYAWNYGWGYNPWWGSAWGPSWSIGWGPSWAWGPSWGWGPSWSWGWGGGWHPGPGHGPAWSGNNWRPSSPGASRPNVEGGIRPTTPGRRPGSSSAASAVYNNANTNYRPAAVAGNNHNGSNTTINANAGRRPSTVGTTTAGNRGTSTSATVNNSGRQGRTTTTTPSYNTNTRPTNNNSSSWSAGSRQSSGSSFSGSRGSMGGGSRSTDGSGGGRSGRH